MIVAITGGTGFIGQKLVSRHLAQGHEVRVLSRRKAVEPGAKLCSGDLSDTDALRAFVDAADILYHCAGEIRDFCEGGLTGNLWKLQQGEVNTFKMLFGMGRISFATYLQITTFSFIKFIRRWGIVKTRSLLGAIRIRRKYEGASYWRSRVYWFAYLRGIVEGRA